MCDVTGTCVTVGGVVDVTTRAIAYGKFGDEVLSRNARLASIDRQFPPSRGRAMSIDFL